MLGRLLSSASSATTSPSATRPSTAAGFEGEDLYTRTLLYPDTSILPHGGSLSGSGYISASGSSADGEHIDIDCARDIRVIIGQEGGSGSEGKSVVYDSKPGASFPAQCASPNHSSFGFDDAPPSPGLCGGFSRRRRSPAPFNPSNSPHSGSGIAGRDEWMLITDCMFGNVAMAYKGPSTKLHILPGLPQDNKSGSTTPASEGRSKGRNSFHSQHNPSPFSPHGFSTKNRKSVLITRLFSVVIPPISSGRTFLPQDQSQPGSLNAPNGFPFPRMAQAQGSGSTTPKPMKPVKTSMYAIGLVISLPPSTANNSIKRCPNCWSIEYDIDSRQPSHGYYCCDVAAASMDDEYRADQVLVESSPDSGIAEDQMEYITKNWDIITRALADLQSVAQIKIVEGLQASGIVSPTSSQPSYKYRNRVELRPGALMYDEALRLEVERFRWRVVSGIKIPRVVTGQGRWGVWREEARSLNKRLGGKDQNFLFLTLLTAFLGHHKEWLDVLGPIDYRCKHQMQKQFSSATNEDTIIPSRTVVISHDKISARKLIYLLSAFLPAKSLPAWPSPDHAFLPSRASSTNLLSQSPPAMSYMSQNSRGSVRQKPRKRPSKLSMIHGEAGEAGGWDIPVTHGCDASVLRQQGDSLQLAPSAGSTRKSSNIHPHPITTSASKFTDGHHKESRPGSSGSTASFSLMHALRRSGTGNTSTDSSTTGSSTGTSGWSFLSNIWSIQRSSSTGCTSEASTYPDELMDCPTRSSTGISGEKYDEEAVVQDHDLYPGYEDHLQSPPRFDNHVRPFPSDTPLNISIGEDGIVDVELPPVSYPQLSNSVFGHSSANTSSPIGSPGNLGYGFSMLSLDRGSLNSSSLLQSTDDTNDITMNVAGWMDDERFHPDFALQAVRSYCELEADVKRAMRSEPTPSGKYRAPGQWVTVCSVLLADTKNFRIKRLTLKRRKLNQSNVTINTNQTPTTPLTAFFDPISPSFRRLPSATFSDEEDREEEKFEEEWVMDMDDTLATAVERTIGIDVDARATTKSNKPRSLLGKETSTTPSTPDASSNRNLGSDCKSIILGALQEVVKKCVGGRAGEPGLVENFLTEGVLEWLNDVEDFPPHMVQQHA